MALDGGKIKSLMNNGSMQRLAEALARVVMSEGRSRDSGVKGLMPDLHQRTMLDYTPPSIHAPYSHLHGTALHITPGDVDISRGSFDFRMGRGIAWCDEIREGLNENDLDDMEHKILEPGEKFEFEASPDGDRVYYITSNESIEHTPDLEVEVHAKSTTGRVGCQCASAGRTSWGDKIILLQPLAFNLIGTAGKTSFAQAVVRYKETPFMTREQTLKEKVIGIEDSEALEEALTPRGLRMRFDTKRAYRARKTKEAIDMEARDLDWTRWYDLIERDSGITLDRKTLYLLGSLGIISLNGACGIISKEQETFTGLGGFGCLAGVIQDGFRGQITMEPYFFVKKRIRRGDLAGHVLIDRIEGDAPEAQTAYRGEYQNQKAPRLPKMFKIS